MPWYAQYAEGEWPETGAVPDTHKHYANDGSFMEQSYKAIGYVQVTPVGSADPVDEPEPEPAPASVPPSGSRRGR
ncbi:MAG: hypothetical protein M3443_11400 [Actinomycetota bacterium]|nr:hypothetical protein [Actinomycetota bacterium]